MNTTISNTEDEGTIMIHPSPILNLTKEQLTEEITNLTTTEMNSNLQIFSLNTYNITNHNIKYYDDKGGEITSITFNSSYLHINVSLKSNREGYIVGIAQAQLLEDPNSFQVFLRLNSSSLPAISSWKCYLEYGKEDEVYSNNNTQFYVDYYGCQMHFDQLMHSTNYSFFFVTVSQFTTNIDLRGPFRMETATLNAACHPHYNIILIFIIFAYLLIS